jgi:hypothetical protein
VSNVPAVALRDERIEEILAVASSLGESLPDDVARKLIRTAYVQGYEDAVTEDEA